MTSLYFSGAAEEYLTRALFEGGVKKILYEFWSMHQARTENFIDQMQHDYPDVQCILSSGKPLGLLSWRKRKERYFTHIAGTWERWHLITELDLDVMSDVTSDMLTEWREEMLRRWPEAPIMPVWHPSRGMDAWTSYCYDSRYRYLAIGSEVTDLRLRKRLIAEARDRDKQVHLFGATRSRTALPSLLADSTDSTAWIGSGQKSDDVYVFQNNDFKRVSGKDERRSYRDYFRSIGCNARSVEALDVAETRKANILAWKFFAGRLEEVRKRQAKLDGEEVPR